MFCKISNRTIGSTRRISKMKKRTAIGISLLAMLMVAVLASSLGCGAGGVGGSAPSPGALYFYVDT
jgi:hypothetical protein